MSNLQRGFWSFLFFTLVGPFFAALGAALVLPILMSQQMGPFAPGGDGLAGGGVPVSAALLMAQTGLLAVRIYIWSAIPAAIAGLIFATCVSRGWATGWATAGIAGVVGFSVAAIVTAFPHGGLLPYIALFAGLVAIVCRAAIRQAGLLGKDRLA
jgi:hypothetical protein